MNSKALTVTLAAVALAAASSVFAASNAEPNPPRSIDPNIPFAEFRVVLLAVDHKLDAAAMHQLGQQLSQRKDTALDKVAKEIAGTGTFMVLGNPASMSVVEGEPFPLVRLEGVTRKLPVKFSNGMDQVPVQVEVGYRVDLDAPHLDTATGKLTTTMLLQHSALADDGRVATVVLDEKDSLAVGDVHIMSWVLAGKQYAMAVRAERF